MRWRCCLLLLLVITECGANTVGNDYATTTACARAFPAAPPNGAYIATESLQRGVHTRFSLGAPDGPTNVPVPPNRVTVPDLVWTLTLTIPPGMPSPDALTMEVQTFSTPPGERIGHGTDTTDRFGAPIHAGMTYTWSGPVYVSPLAQGFAQPAGPLLWPQFMSPPGALSAGQLTFSLHPDSGSLRADTFRVKPREVCG